MNYSSPTPLPAPCIVDQGIIVQKEDMQRLLNDLRQVRYFHFQDERLVAAGEGLVMDVFCDPSLSTLVANHTLYLNVSSFDFLELSQSAEAVSQFDLVQDNRKLRLVPLNNPLQEAECRSLKVVALEAMMNEVLSASWDARLDGDDHLPL
jgi:hypothetical protein